MSTARINGKAYDSSDVNVAILGRPIIEVTEVSYNSEREHQLNYRLGSGKPSSYSEGKYSYSASITLLMSEVVGIENAMGGDKDITKIKPFPITVAYLNDDNDIVVDVITAKFQSQGREVDGEMGLSKQFDLFVLNIEYNK
ncbi:hypothetical protein [Flammeovirga sp. SJP92]|uniref:hypothetical protein n=1 Tax=Flammeovirga sp. SJP92 TaxID=1775430 RepID=UPI0007893229|nr:hypothetical protein [Flammeovirga sp. SJP92]KXX70780.1 hypothetical protein AVL50_07170 [Flammeovirga sp. SJP92]